MVRFGRAIRALRMRRRWRQVDLAAAARVSQSVIARIELGLGGRMTVEKLEAVAHALGARLDVRLSWQGEALDRLLDHDHAALVELMTKRIGAAGWDVRTEVTFWIRGERGAVDILAWHAGTRTVLVVEIKSVVPDIQATLAAHDRKARLGLAIATSVGWRGTSVGRLLVIGESRTARRRVAANRVTFAATLPDRALQVRRFLANPRTAVEPLRGLIYVSASPDPITRHRQARRAKAA